MTGSRYDIRPLLCMFDNDPAVLAQHAGVTHRTVNRWRVEGGVPEEEADRVAVRCKFHPSEVWGDEWRQRGLSAVVEPSLFEFEGWD